jgi:hypothetical protein
MNANLPAEISRMFRAVYYGGNYTWVNIKDSLHGVDWKMATAKIDELNTIAGLVFHMNYYARIVAKVLEGEILKGSDKESFAHAPIHSQEGWEKLLEQFWSDAERFANLVEKMPEQRLWEVFKEESTAITIRIFTGGD